MVIKNINYTLSIVDDPVELYVFAFVKNVTRGELIHKTTHSNIIINSIKP